MQRLTCLVLLAFAATASAEPRRERLRSRRTHATVVRPAPNDRNVRVYKNPRTGHDVRRGIVYERRPISEIRRDPFVVRFNVGYRPRFGWRHFHTVGWSSTWGIRSWNTVSTVTCEAANDETGELYPVVADRSTLAWNDESVNTVLDAALDQCAADAGAEVCAPVEPACTYQ